MRKNAGPLERQDALMFDVGSANDLKLAARRAGLTPVDLKKLSSSEILKTILPVLRGLGVVTMPDTIFRRTTVKDTSIMAVASLKQLEKIGWLTSFSEIDDRIILESRPPRIISSRAPRSLEIEVALFCPNIHELDLEGIEAEYAKRELVPVDFYTLCQLNSDDQYLTDFIHNVTLWQDEEDVCYCASFSNLIQREVSIARLESPLHKNVWYAGIAVG